MNRRALIVMTCGCLVLLLGTGTRQSMGLFLGPVSRELVLDTQVFSLAIGIQNLLLGLAQPVTSAIADRFGTARTVAVCGVLYVLGLLILSGAATPFGLYAGAGVLIGFAASGTGFTLILGAVGRAAAPEARAAALSIVAACGSLGQLIAAPTNQVLIGAFGPHITFLILAAALGLIVPLAAALRGKASDTHDPLTEGQTLREAIGEAAQHRGYVLLVVGFYVCGFQVQFVATHLPNFLTQHGEGELAGLAIGMIGFFNFLGTLAFGWAAQRWSKKKLLSLLYLLRSLAFIMFLAVPLTNVSVLVFAAWLGFLWLGTVPLTTGLVAQMFGVRYMTTLSGIVFLSHQLGSFTGSWIGGVMFDLTGSYDIMWQVAIALGFAAALLHMPIDERRVDRAAA